MGYILKQICHELIIETGDGFMQVHYTFQFTFAWVQNSP